MKLNTNLDYQSDQAREAGWGGDGVAVSLIPAVLGVAFFPTLHILVAGREHFQFSALTNNKLH